MSSAEAELKRLLLEIEQHETNYDVRERLVYRAFGIAAGLGLPVGIRVDPTEKEPWPVVCITLSTGEVSWHCPPNKTPWSGYTTEEKYKRIHEWRK